MQDNETRTKQFARSALRRILNRLADNAVERSWRKWRAFNAHSVLAALHLALKHKMMKLKQKCIRTMKKKVRATEQALVLREARRLKLQLLQTWLTPWQEFLLPIHAIERAFRHWQSQAQKQTLELDLSNATTMVATLKPVVAHLKESLQCQKTLNSWRNLTWTKKQRQQDKLHSCLEDEKAILARQLVGVQLRLDGVQHRLIDRQAQHAKTVRQSDVRRGITILGGLLTWFTR